jgi:transcriptional regulator with XRE-family HTH domain
MSLPDITENLRDEMYKNNLIRGKMAELGFTVESLSEKTKLSTETISRVRNGGNVNIETLTTVASALDIPMPELFEQRSAA